MTKKTCCLLLALLQLLPVEAEAKEAIAFVAQVDSEALAEEAILLLHCLATRSDTSWEFSGEARGNHWLKVVEKSGRLNGTYHRASTAKEFTLQPGGSDQACDTLEPGSPATSGSLAEKAIEPAPSFAPALDTPEMESRSSAGTSPWLWVGIASVAVAGFLYWKSRQPDHRGIEMKN